MVDKDSRLSLKMRLVETIVREDRAISDATITTRFRGLIDTGMLTGFSRELERVVLIERVWKTSFSTGKQPGQWELSIADEKGTDLAKIPHCDLKDLRFSARVVKGKKGKEDHTFIFLSLIVSHENSPAQKTLICLIPSTVMVSLVQEPEVPPARKPVEEEKTA